MGWDESTKYAYRFKRYKMCLNRISLYASVIAAEVGRAVDTEWNKI